MAQVLGVTRNEKNDGDGITSADELAKGEKRNVTIDEVGQLYENGQNFPLGIYLCIY